ncbi:helix-turn-helix domain-containing protein [Glacieibacterium megasporae]|uniref:helix-turn-helix domain-containing protein n=2 Tax=Sphingosinicellaceae TaxID=2820280 RepID=UPI001CAA7960|nr:AraC family transcriptional regulator [Polymorphobacter megasporae]UAJ12518.1 AraC family transcriptional regulator [Polymorphobacter megasporae]
MAYFNAPDTRTIVTSKLGRGVVGISRLRANHPLGVIDYTVIEEAIMVAYQHQPLRCDVFLEDRHVPVRGAGPAKFTVYDYRRRWNCEIKTGIDATNFFVPRTTLDALSEGGRVADLIVRPGEVLDDPVVRGLAAALESAFAAPERTNPLFLDHLGWAFAAHCATFLEPQRATGIANGKLSVRQERLAKEMISARLNGDITVTDLAAACGLSIAHFSRAFRRSTDVPPHRWLMMRRIDRARHLLQTTQASLADIALECGFSDQVHLTHAFTRNVGAPPGAWRRGSCD